MILIFAALNGKAEFWTPRRFEEGLSFWHLKAYWTIGNEAHASGKLQQWAGRVKKDQKAKGQRSVKPNSPDEIPTSGHPTPNSDSGEVLDHFKWGGQAGASCTVGGASYIKHFCCQIVFFTSSHINRQNAVFIIIQTLHIEGPQELRGWRGSKLVVVTGAPPPPPRTAPSLTWAELEG